MIKKSGLPLPDKSTEEGFFNYHGLHLGHSRCIGRWNYLLENDDNHKEFYKKFKNIADTSVFWTLHASCDNDIKNEIQYMIKVGDKICLT
jgi:hypothetical protein